MIAYGTHDDMDDPPHVPTYDYGAPILKKQKQENMISALVDAATALAKVCHLHCSGTCYISNYTC